MNRTEANPRTNRRQDILIVAITLMTAWIVFVCIMIEHLNALNNYILPNDREKQVSSLSGGSMAWRATMMDEAKWREYYLPDSEKTRALTSAEENHMREDIDRSAKNYTLQQWVLTAGCMQYLLIALVGGIAVNQISTVRGWRRNWLGCLIALIVFAGSMAVFRGYIRANID